MLSSFRFVERRNWPFSIRQVVLECWQLYTKVPNLAKLKSFSIQTSEVTHPDILEEQDRTQSVGKMQIRRRISCAFLALVTIITVHVQSYTFGGISRTKFGCISVSNLYAKSSRKGKDQLVQFISLEDCLRVPLPQLEPRKTDSVVTKPKPTSEPPLNTPQTFDPIISNTQEIKAEKEIEYDKELYKDEFSLETVSGEFQESIQDKVPVIELKCDDILEQSQKTADKSTDKIGKITDKGEQSIIEALPSLESNVDQEKVGEFTHDQEGVHVALEEAKDINEAGGMQKQSTITGANDLVQELDQQVHEEEEDISEIPNIIKRAILDPPKPLEIIEVDTLPHTSFSSVLKSRPKKSASAQAPPENDTKLLHARSINDLLEGNKQWVSTQKDQDSEFFNKLCNTNTPAYMWIGCSDSRIPANEMINVDAGKIFVANNVANMVVESDNNLMSTLQYAVQFLKIKHILVVGHYECGGIRASMSKTAMPPPLGQWISNIQKVYQLHKSELDAIQDPHERHRLLVELNVVEQAWNVLQTSAVQQQRMQTFSDKPENMVQVHALVFDPKDGILRSLDSELHKKMKTVEEISQETDLKK